MAPLQNTSFRSAMDPPQRGLVFGLHALVREMEHQGVTAAQVLEGTGLTPATLLDHRASVSRAQRLAIYANAVRLARRADVGLRAGQRQKISDFGIYGYSLACNRTLGDVMELSFPHLAQAGPVLRISQRLENGVRILRSHEPHSLGDLLPFAAEFWRSSSHSLLSKILGARFPSIRMLLPYPAPAHWREYSKIFDCKIEFDAGVMEWHISTDLDEWPLPEANPTTAIACSQICERMLPAGGSSPALERSVLEVLVAGPGRFRTVEEVADALAMSVRTFYRRLREEGLSYQGLVDEMRMKLAIEFLSHTAVPIDQIAAHTGFADASNFRRAFKRWTGVAPGAYRESRRHGGRA
jgi:AraC-like DNA-binding protein